MTFFSQCYIPYSHHKELGCQEGPIEKSIIIILIDLWCILLRSDWQVLLTGITWCVVKKIKPVRGFDSSSGVGSIASCCSGK